MTRSKGCSNSLQVTLASLLGLAAVAAATAAEIRQSTTAYDAGRYSLRVEAWVDAPQADVYRLLTDYAHLGRINPSIRTSELLPADADGQRRVRTETDACVLFYCRRIHQVQRVREAGDGAVTAEVVPELSDFRYGTARFELSPEDGGTRVLIQGAFEPGFWIPPLIGPWMIRRKVLDETLDTVANLERVAPLPDAAVPATPQ